jgi:hypothetical protein
MPFKDRAMPKRPTNEQQRDHSWAVYHLKVTPAKLGGIVYEQPDEQAAIKQAIEGFKGAGKPAWPADCTAAELSNRAHVSALHDNHAEPKSFDHFLRWRPFPVNDLTYIGSLNASPPCPCVLASRLLNFGAEQIDYLFSSKNAHSGPVFGQRHCVPVRLSGCGRSLQFGRTSAPIIPHCVHTALGHRSLSATSSGHRSASTTALWWQFSPSEQ